MQRPFKTGDLIEVAEVTGYVQQLNMRTTVVMTLDGILVQVPNSAVYKSNIRNFTTNCNRREVFDVGIGYDDTINDAQDIAMSVLLDHPAVLKDPEPWVLVNDLSASTVNLRVYFWLDGSQHSWLKVRSSVIRLVKRAFQEKGISMPDEAREIIFPRGVHVTMEKPEDDGGPEENARSVKETAAGGGDSEAAATRAEGGLQSEAGMIREQARQAQPVEPEENLLHDEPESETQ
jgi:small-conductance mechanosensitive channel